MYVVEVLPANALTPAQISAPRVPTGGRAGGAPAQGALARASER
jgi:hypothetical protein